jgi:hypothetical protein
MKLLSRLLLLFYVISLCAGTAEYALRRFGFDPWKSKQPDRGDNYLSHDTVLGWKNRPGAHTVPSSIGDGSMYVKNYWPNGARISRPNEAHNGPIMALLGCSITEGYGLGDSDTLGWKLQERWPGVNVLNFGTAGYSGCQSLLRLEQLLAGPQIPQVVLYDFASFHTPRNVAAPDWLNLLSELTAEQNAKMPYCDLSAGGGLETHALEGYTELPFRDSSALVRLIEQGLYAVSSWTRVRQAHTITENIFLRMKEDVEKKGALFAVVLIGPPLADDILMQEYDRFLRSQGILTIPCLSELIDKPQYVVPGDNHPNGAMNELRAECVTRGLLDYCRQNRTSSFCRAAPK